MCKASPPCVSIGLTIVSIIAAACVAHADAFAADYASAGSQDGDIALAGEQSFLIQNVPANSETKWTVFLRTTVTTGYSEYYVFEELYSETDQSGPSAVAPSLEYTISENESFRVTAIVLNDTQPTPVEKDFHWNFFVTAPDVVISQVIFPDNDIIYAGQPFTLDVHIVNASHLPAETGASEKQEVHFYIDDAYAGAVEYPDLPPLSHFISVTSPELTIPAPGNHTIRVIVDATNLINEGFPEFEDNNEVTFNRFAPGLDWLQVPDVDDLDINIAIAEKTMKKSGFQVVELRLVSSTFSDCIVDQTPSAGTWVAPENNTVVLTSTSAIQCNSRVTSPEVLEVWQRGSTQTIQWETSGTFCANKVRIEVWKKGKFYATIKDKTLNDGEFVWKIKRGQFKPGNYRLRIVDASMFSASYIYQSFSLSNE